MNLILIFFIFVILQFLNKFFINSKILFFILGDSIRLISLFIIIIFLLNYLNKISKQYKFLIFILALFLIHEISILDNKIIQIDRGYYFIYIFSTFTCLLSLSNINFNIFKKFIFISLSLLFYYLFLLTQPLEYFHLFSETQINRNLSIIIYWIKNSSMSFEKIDYLSKLFYDILPFTGQERGYNYLMVNLYHISGFDPGDTRYNFGILSEGYLFYGYIGIALLSLVTFFIYYIIHKIFYRLKDDIFFYFCFFHLMSQTYWLYRGGLSLYWKIILFFFHLFICIFVSIINIFDLKEKINFHVNFCNNFCL